MPTTHLRTCHLCEANCGIIVTVDGRSVLSIRGDSDDPLSRGHICPKATAIADLESDPDRLRTPVKRVGGAWHPIAWDTAFAEIAARVAAIRAAGGETAIYAGNPNAHNYSIAPQLPLLRKALGAKAMFSASSVDQVPHQLVQLWMYGHNALFPIPDIDRTRHMVIIGGNPLASNGSVWTVPDVRTRIAALQARGGRLTVIDPRRTETAAVAGAHHFIRPGSDPALLIALLLALDEAGLVAPGRLAAMLAGWDAAWAALRRFDITRLAAACGIDAAVIRDLAAQLGDGSPAIVYGRIGVSTAAFGTLNHWLINLLNIATGNLDRIGGAMFSTPAVDIVGQTGSGSRGRFHSRVSGHPEVLGEFPAVAMAEEIATPGAGQIKAFFTIAGNPVLSVPDGNALDAALATLDLMVSIDMYVTATSAHADYILPPCGPLEKDHYPLFLAPIAVRNFAKYSPPTFPPTPGSKSDWEIVAELARAIAGAQGQPLPNIVPPRDSLDRMLRNAPRGLTLADVEAHPHGLDLGALEPRLPDRLRTPDKTIACAPAELIADLAARFADWLSAPPADGLVLIGRRHVRNNNSWLGNSHRLAKGPPRCTLMIHPGDAAPRDIADGDRVVVRSGAGTVEVAAEITDSVMPGVVSMPHGFGHHRPGVRLAVAQAHPGASVNDLTERHRIDPLSGNAALVGTPVDVAPVRSAVAAE
ncbi:molybdopterin oxidoreductase family protein [Polymorphobacter fuscus]|uniref:Molybdopterin-dependent oxidoreductase n=1 Tax=Sandarakinorhabdus fusca TaxID=1439888 RepID=A0A7C9GRL6_9SPHN|nr:molybdopterin oxidoreductase family protein [Polymorphobacter fuscus]KAB7644111.1 molybdopterin-dependent oxidoreductase [Polymorphobacter fuscus]MQT18496.1 molybdopterin-dependent oxidoreductase [Polymorphobacter fuscus]